MTIAGSDSGGGAGIQADLHAFSFFDVFGVTAVTAVTAQNPKQVVAVHPLPPEAVLQQIQAVFAEFRVGAVKTGMLFNGEIVRVVARALARHPDVPVVVDPVMVATSGGRLLLDDAVAALREQLLPRARIVTPNLPEAEALAGAALRTPQEIADAALGLARRCDAVVVIKGGHRADEAAVDVASDGGRVWTLVSPRVPAASTHGTGCSFSAALAACLAAGDDPLLALRKAKAYVYAALRSCVRVGPDVWARQRPANLPLHDIECRES